MASDKAELQFWNYVYEIKKQERYFCFYKQQSALYANLINGFLCVTSVSGVASYFSNFPWFVWGTIIFTSSIISATNHLIPFSKYDNKISLMMPEYDNLFNRVLYTWNTICDLSDSEVYEKILSFRNEVTGLEAKYIGTAELRPRKKLTIKAQDEATRFVNYYLKSEGEPNDAGKRDKQAIHSK